MKTFRFSVIAVLLASTFLAYPAVANTLYKCTDRSGAVLYTNQKISKKECMVLSHMQSPSVSSPSSGAGTSRPRAATGSSATPTPSDFPRVTGNEQKARDSDRRAILDKELTNEMQNLDKAKKAITEAVSQPPDKQQPLRDTVALHERNIEALKKEIGNLR